MYANVVTTRQRVPYSNLPEAAAIITHSGPGFWAGTSSLQGLVRSEGGKDVSNTNNLQRWAKGTVHFAYKRFLTAAPVAVTGTGCSSSRMSIGKRKARWKPCDDPKASDQNLQMILPIAVISQNAALAASLKGRQFWLMLDDCSCNRYMPTLP
jgi:hypothetical protein